MEVVWVVTSESDAFVQAMMAEGKWVEKKALLEKAAKVHVAHPQAAGQGDGIDWHMLGRRTSCVCASYCADGSVWLWLRLFRVEKGAKGGRGNSRAV